MHQPGFSRVSRRAFMRLSGGAIALAASGDLLVGCGGSGNSLSHYTYRRSFDISANSNPTLTDIVVDPLGNIYVSSLNSYPIQKFSSDGKRLMAFNADRGYQGVTADASGNVYGLSLLEHQIDKFDNTGKLVLSFGKGELTQPAFIGIDGNGTLYVQDTYTNRTERFSPDGTYQNGFKPRGFFTGTPGYLIVNTGGDYYVMDYITYYQRGIKKYSNSGFLLSSFTDHVVEPSYMACDGRGNVFVMEGTTEFSIMIFDTNGAFQTSFPLQPGSNGPLTAGKDGTIYILSRASGISQNSVTIYSSG